MRPSIGKVMTVRDATDSDSPAVQRLLDQLGYDLPLDIVRDNIRAHQEPGYRILVGVIDGHVMAFISLHCFKLMHWKEMVGRISAFCVDEGFRSKGVGRQLLHAAEEWMTSCGCAKLEVTSNTRRLRAHEFYLGLGYVEDSRRFVKYLKR